MNANEREREERERNEEEKMKEKSENGKYFSHLHDFLGSHLARRFEFVGILRNNAETMESNT